MQVKPGKPHAARALGRDLVLWRDAAGALKCLEDHCPHRGARLSRGEVLGDHIACRYHGVTLDGSGKIVRVPAMPDCPLEGRSPVESFPVAESNDAIFVYFGSGRQAAPPPLELPEEFTSPEWSAILCVSPWSCNYRYALDNLADPMHGSYLHANSFTLAFGAKQDLMRIEKTARGFIVARVEQQDENFDWTEMVTETAAPYCRLDIPYPPAAGPGGVFRIIGFTTPVDEGNCLVFFWRLRKASGLRARGLALPLSRDARGAALARAGAGPRDAHQHAGGRAPARDALPARSRRRPHPPGAGEQGQGAARRAGRRRGALGGLTRPCRRAGLVRRSARCRPTRR